MHTVEEIHVYQDDVVDAMHRQDYGIVLAHMGGGKTVSAGTYMAETLEDKTIKRWLVLCPKRVGLKVWPSEFINWEHLLDFEVAVAIGTGEERMAAMEGEAEIVVLNFENIEWFYDTYGDMIWEELGFDGLIIDELSRLRNSKGIRFKKMSKTIRRFKKRFGLTGTFTSGLIEHVYGQVFLIDAGKRLGKGFNKFRNKFFNKEGPMGWQWEPMPDAMDKILDAIADMAIIVPDEAYKDHLPPLIPVPVPVDLPKSVRFSYDKLESDFVHEIDGTEIMIANSGVMVGKLQQVANGFIYDEDKTPLWMHDAKLDALEEVFENQNGAPLIVAYHFKEDLEMILKRFGRVPHIGSGVSDAVANARIDQWNDKGFPMMLIHPASAGHGLNLQAGGNAIAWYSIPWSLELYEQTCARLRRQGQPSDQVWNYLIYAEGTVDNDIMEAQTTKKSVDTAVMTGMKQRAGLM